LSRSPFPPIDFGASGPADGPARPESLGVPFALAIGMLRRRAPLILVILALGLGAGYAVLSQMTPQYSSEVSILIQQRRTPVSDLQTISAEPGSSSNEIRTQVDILRSPALARQVILRTGLLDEPEFQPTPGLMARAMAVLRQAFGITNPPARELTQDQRVELLTYGLLGRMTIANEVRSNVMKIGITTASPALSARIANAYADEFLEASRRQKYAAARRAQEWLEGRLRDLATKVRESERAVAEFRAAHGLRDNASDRRGQRSPSVAEQQLAAVSAQVTAAAADRARKEAQAAQVAQMLRTPDGRDTLPEVLGSSLIQRLREAEASAAAREAEIASRAGARSPDLIAARAQRAGLQARIRQETQNALAGLQNELATARAQESSLRETLNGLRNTVSAEQTAEIQLQQLLAEADANRSIFESFLGRSTQLANVSGIQEADAEIVSPAVPPLAPSAPKKGRALAVIGMIALVIGVGAAVLIERLRTGFRTPEELEAKTGLPVVGVVPKLPRRMRRLVASEARHVDFDAALSRMRGTLQVMHDGRSPQMLIVTSALPAEGKSLLAAGLARNAAEAGLKVLLIDCDMRNPTLASLLDLPSGPGLSDLLQGTMIAGKEPVVRRAPGGFDVITTGATARSAQDLLASSSMDGLLRAVRARYDVVVLDTPPVLAVTDTMLLVRKVDAVLMTTRWDQTPQSVVQSAVRLLRNSGALNMFAALTQVDLRRYSTDGDSPLAFMHRKYRGYNAMIAR
jgi:capsular exopolysaccharide synthesis family protein